MDDIFKSKDEVQREEKISNLFKSNEALKGEELKEALKEIPKTENFPPVETDKKNWKVFIVALIIFLILGLSATAGYFFWQYKKVLNNSNPEAASGEAEKIVEKIKAFMELPSEVPTVATITNREKLQDQAFFSNAQNGDKVLIYVQAKKAILYRPDTNKVVESVSLFAKNSSIVEDGANVKEAVATESAEKLVEKIESNVKVDVFNGTEIKGLAKTTADKLLGMENVELAKTGNAQKSDYTKILVIDLSEKNSVAAKIIAEKLGGEVGLLPEGEIKGTADILVIAGKM